MNFSSCAIKDRDLLCCQATEIRLAGYFMPFEICYNRVVNSKTALGHEPGYKAESTFLKKIDD